MTTVPGRTGQRGQAVTRRVLWAGVLALLLLSGPGAAAGSRALPAGNWVGVESAAQGVGSMPFVRLDVDRVSRRGRHCRTALHRAVPGGRHGQHRRRLQSGGRHLERGGGALTITVTTSTRAYCPPPSISEPYLAALNGVTGYTLLGTTLVLHGVAGDLTFSL